MRETILDYHGKEHVTIDELNAGGPFPAGKLNTAYAKYFVGKSYLTAISTSQVPLFAVSFEPGCRNNWHIHKAAKGGGQVLIATAGRGYCQIWGEEAFEMLPGDVVHIPANVKHWHGAAPDTAFQHLALEVPGEEASTEWEEPVDAADYERLN
ncbi:MAG: cupin domain-containing protein [Desulfovibrio sp.]|nr:cupin domain-containing protein [Desulfovibrio sp.]